MIEDPVKKTSPQQHLQPILPSLTADGVHIGTEGDVTMLVSTSNPKLLEFTHLPIYAGTLCNVVTDRQNLPLNRVRAERALTTCLSGVSVRVIFRTGKLYGNGGRSISPLYAHLPFAATAKVTLESSQ